MAKISTLKDIEGNIIYPQTLTSAIYSEDSKTLIEYIEENIKTNSTGSTDTSDKIFLIGAKAQTESATTYSDNEIYATDGTLTTKSIKIGGDAVTLEYDSTNKCINFTFS